MAANLLFPGGDVLESFLQNMADKIIAMVDEILTEKADAMIYDIMQPKIEDSLKAVFSSSPVQLEAAKMFNKEIFPIYDRSLKDFASAKQLIDGAEGAAKQAFDKYTTAVVDSKGDATLIEQAKNKFKEDMQKINDEQVKYDAEGGGKLQKFLLDKNNLFEKLEDGAMIENYLTNPVAPVMDAISEIINKTEATYNELKKNMEDAEKNQKELDERRISSLRIPGISACPAIKSMYKNEKTKITEMLKEADNKKKDENNKFNPIELKKDLANPTELKKDLANPIALAKQLTNKINGGKSTKKMRKIRKRTNKKMSNAFF
jgi:hypothetical protein